MQNLNTGRPTPEGYTSNYRKPTLKIFCIMIDNNNAIFTE